MSVMTVDPYEREQAGDTALWIVAALVVAALHVGVVAAYLLLRPAPEGIARHRSSMSPSCRLQISPPRPPPKHSQPNRRRRSSSPIPPPKDELSRRMSPSRSRAAHEGRIRPAARTRSAACRTASARTCSRTRASGSKSRSSLRLPRSPPSRRLKPRSRSSRSVLRANPPPMKRPREKKHKHCAPETRRSAGEQARTACDGAQSRNGQRRSTGRASIVGERSGGAYSERMPATPSGSRDSGTVARRRHHRSQRAAGVAAARRQFRLVCAR